jgi:hypothetical protein
MGCRRRATAVPSIFSVAGYRVPGTPQRYDHVMIRRYGSPNARKVLVLGPGTFGGAGDFSLVGPYLAAQRPRGLQGHRRDHRRRRHDPLLAAPAHNAFLQTVVPWLERIPLR